MKVLVTGAGGFLGSQIIGSLSQSNHQVTGVTSRINLAKEFQGNFRISKVDWDNPDSLLEICDSQDVVIHAAGMNYDECARDPARADEFNGGATARLVDAAIKKHISNFIYLSTIHVYADPLTGKFDESSPVTAKHAYATSHLLGEKAVLEKTENHQIIGKILRVGNTFGTPIFDREGFLWENLIHQSCKSLVEMNKIEINSNPNIQRDFVPIKYFLTELESVLNDKMDSPQRIINLISGTSLSISEIVKVVTKVFEVYSAYIDQPLLLFNESSKDVEQLVVKNSELAILSPFSTELLEDEISSIFQYLIGKKKNAM